MLVRPRPHWLRLLFVWRGSIDPFGAAVGGCERLASTPILFTYSVIIHRTIYLYCLLGHEIEEPFDDSPNDLALDAICWTIETSLRERLGDTDWPQQPQPRNFVLT